VPRLEALYEGRRDGCGCKPPAAELAGKPDGSACKPWLRVERDEKRYEACMKIAESIGPVDSPKKAFTLLGQALGAEDQEVFGAMYLDTHLQIRGLAETGRGEMDAVMAPIGPTLRIAIAEGATGVLIFHTHPTLYTEPSDADVQVTAAFDAACRAVHLFLVDHIIIGGGRRFFSFADAGYLK
jgi:DNA repair protein RadC